MNDAKVSDHHAIIPTEQFVDLTHMTDRERKIYDLVVRRFLAVLYPPCIYEETMLTVRCGGEELAARGDVVKQSGWREVYENREEEEEENQELRRQLLPSLRH